MAAQGCSGGEGAVVQGLLEPIYDDAGEVHDMVDQDESDKQSVGRQSVASTA